MADYVDNLIVNVQGRADVERLTAAVQAEEAAVLAAVAAYGQQSAQARAAATALQNYQQQLQTVQNTVRSTTTNTRGYQQSMLAASYALQDFTSANGGLTQQLMSVNNNIPQILMGLGASAGLTAVISGLTTVVTVAAPHITRWVESLDLIPKSVDASKTALQQLQERITELEKRPYRIAVETVELDEAKRKLKELQEAQRAFEAAKEGKTIWEKAAGEQVKGTLEAEGPRTKAAMEAVKQQIATEEIGRDKEARKAAADKKSADEAIARIQKNLERNDLAPPERAMANIDLMLRQREAKKAEQRFADAVTKITRDGGIAEIKAGQLKAGAEAGNKPNERNELAGRFRAAGDEGLAAGLEASTPEEMERQQAQEDAWANAEDRWNANAPKRAKRRAFDKASAQEAHEAWKRRQLNPNPNAPPFNAPSGALIAPVPRVPLRQWGKADADAGRARGAPGAPGGPGPADMPEARGVPVGKPKYTALERRHLKAQAAKRAKEDRLTRIRFANAARNRQRNPAAHPAAKGPPRQAQPAAAQQAAQTILEENAKLKAELGQVKQLLGQVAKGMKQQGAQFGANARRQQQDGDSFLPVTW